GLTAAGVLIALLAPLTGTRADGSGRRRRGLAVQTAITVALCATMALVRPDPDALTANVLLGIALLAVGNLTFELASVHYNALLPHVATPATLGRVSGLGWGAGYLGGIVLLLVLFVGFIDPEVGWFGVTSADGANIRVAVLVSALWFGVFAVPVLLAVPDEPADALAARRESVVQAYRRIVADVRDLWRTSRSTVLFLLASAVYRDGLAGVFTFGAVIASGTFGFSASEVVVFAIAANVVAGVSTLLAGLLDDRVGPRALIVGSLVGLVVAGVATFVLAGAGTSAFWVCGLLLCVFVGPAQSASRSLLTRVTPAGRESQMFGLYATTGRAASFLAPLAFATFVSVSGSQRWGILGLVLVLALGLAALLPLRLPAAATGGARSPR
ncbi:MFS transporter, partial [Cellulomonas hominis]|nr:MFS transporter [Cellulomonas hominis]